MMAFQFLFIVLVPLVAVAGAVASLFAVGALFDALEHPDELRQRIEGAFRKPPHPARATDHKHFYRAYWSAS